LVILHVSVLEISYVKSKNRQIAVITAPPPPATTVSVENDQQTFTLLPLVLKVTFSCQFFFIYLTSYKFIHEEHKSSL